MKKLTRQGRLTMRFLAVGLALKVVTAVVAYAFLADMQQLANMPL